MAWRAAAAALLLSLAACTPTGVTSPPDFDPEAYPTVRLAVASIEVASAATYPAAMGFIARRRSEQLSQDAQSFLRSRLVAAGGSDFARATVEEATLVEQPRTTGDGIIASATEADWEMAGVLALKVAIVDGVGIERSFATARVAITRTISQHAGVEAKDDFARTIINDLIAAAARELQASIDKNLPEHKAP